MYGSEPRKVVSIRLGEDDLKKLDALVEDAKVADKSDWWESQPSRSSVIRDAIANRHTALVEERNTKTPASRNTKTPASRNTRRARSDK